MGLYSIASDFISKEIGYDDLLCIRYIRTHYPLPYLSLPVQKVGPLSAAYPRYVAKTNR